MKNKKGNPKLTWNDGIKKQRGEEYKTAKIQVLTSNGRKTYG